MSIFCLHDFRPAKVIRGENLLGSVTWGVVFFCIKCNKRKIDSGWSEKGARQHLAWLQSQQHGYPRKES